MRSVTLPIRKYRWSHVFGVATAFALLTGISLSVNAQNPASSSTAQTAAASGQNPVVLDSVIAIINGEVLLESDLQEEMDFSALQPLSLPGGKGLEQRAAQRLINRALIVQQMKEQGMASDISDQEVQENLDALRKQLPACVAYRCETEAGWARFLSDHSLTPSEVQTRWRQRMEILRFIDARFRAGVRIPNAEISNYYNKTFCARIQEAECPSAGAFGSLQENRGNSAAAACECIASRLVKVSSRSGKCPNPRSAIRYSRPGYRRQ